MPKVASLARSGQTLYQEMANPNARIMFIGEAPGADEDAQGKPFVGRAGKLLDNIITAMGLKREDVFIGNILKCRPPGNRDPRPDEIISCLPYLTESDRSDKTRNYYSSGRTRSQDALLDTNKPIGQLRGHFHEYYAGLELPPIKLMATYHPAYLLLRNYSPGQSPACVGGYEEGPGPNSSLPVPKS